MNSLKIISNHANNANIITEDGAGGARALAPLKVESRAPPIIMNCDVIVKAIKIP